MSNLNLCDLKDEIWKDIVGYEGMFQVSNKSRVKSLDKYVPSKCESYINTTLPVSEKIRRQTNCNGYLIVPFRVGGIVKNQRVHRLIAEAFIPNPENKKYVNHINGIKNDNRIENLEWVTANENMIHSFKFLGNVIHSKGKYGKDAIRTKLISQYTKDGVFIASFYGKKEAQRLTGVNEHTISACIYGRCKTGKGFIWEIKEIEK